MTQGMLLGGLCGIGFSLVVGGDHPDHLLEGREEYADSMRMGTARKEHPATTFIHDRVKRRKRFLFSFLYIVTLLVGLKAVALKLFLSCHLEVCS